MNISARFNHWVFDLDGTLTKRILDFRTIKHRLGLPQDRGILEVLAEMPSEEAEQIGRELDAIEYEYALQARAAEGAVTLLASLHERGVKMGILTRNKRDHALTTLDAIGLRHFFDDEVILGRDEAAPKPDPEGIHKILRHWGAEPADTTMTGDFRFDLEAGRAAGAFTIYVDPTAVFTFQHLADLSVARLDEIVDG
jgi:HAD superfamily hydrolase (TIGR01509 family)